MQSTASRLGLALLTSCLGLAGCIEPQATTPARGRMPAANGFRTQLLPTSDLASAFAAAEGVVSQHFEIASADPQAGTIVFAPSEYTRLGGARMRRSGQLILRRPGDQVIASVQVPIDRYATPAARAMHQQVATDDLPSITPIQEEAGLTAQQQEYWSPAGRDYRLEADILSQISAALAATTQPAPTATGPA